MVQGQSRYKVLLMQIKTIGDITMIESGLQAVYLDEKDVRYLIAWLAKNRTSLWERV